ncbi:MAG: CBM20 domain-containing protein [Deltaproteobacteria bacterium]
MGRSLVVVFQVNGCPTAPGEYVGVMGNCPQLGEWHESRALRLEYIDATTWQGSFAFAPGTFAPGNDQAVTYKYAIFHEPAGTGIPRRENRTTRRRPLPASGTAQWRDIWEE